MKAGLRVSLAASILAANTVTAMGQTWETRDDSFASWSLASIVIPSPSKSNKAFTSHEAGQKEDITGEKIEFHLRKKYAIPRNWEEFDKHFAPDSRDVYTPVQWLEHGMYHVNQTLFAAELFERHVNGLLNLEYSLRELGNYDSRSEKNKLDGFFDHAKVKTDFDWDAPIGLYVGVRFQIKCDSIFQFWK